MIKKMLFMRHGQSEANAKKVYAGSSPHVQLTQLGEQQAAAAGRDLIGHEVDAIVASPLDRAIQTAKIAAVEMGFVENLIITDERLHEINVGTLTGQHDDGFVTGYAHINSGQDATAETPADVLERVHSFLVDAAALYDNQVVLIVAHAGVARAFRAILTGVSLESIAGTTIPNAEPFELPLDKLDEVIA